VPPPAPPEEEEEEERRKKEEEKEEEEGGRRSNDAFALACSCSGATATPPGHGVAPQQRRPASSHLGRGSAVLQQLRSLAALSELNGHLARHAVLRHSVVVSPYAVSA